MIRASKNNHSMDRHLQSLFIRTLSALTLTLCTSAHAGLYKWVDDAGKTHYSQIPPPGRTTEELQPSGGAAPIAETAESAINDDTPTETPVGEKPKSEKPQLLPESCESLRRHIALLETNDRVRVRDKQTGDLTVLSGNEKQARINQYKDQLTTSCREQR